MFGIVNFGAFIIAGVLLNLTPGTDTVFILGKSLSNGRTDGIKAALGIGAGSLVHTLFATLGLSVILAESALAFNIVKYLGAAYLVFLGLKAVLSSGKKGYSLSSNSRHPKKGRTFLSAVLTNVLNPKVALFYLAFLPQFIDQNYANPMLSFLILGITFTFTVTIWCLLLAVYSARFSMALQSNQLLGSWLDRVTGLLFISLGLKLALSKQ
ncbi:MAG: LysE family translocator [Cyclobacteriaceae bacterium]